MTVVVLQLTLLKFLKVKCWTLFSALRDLIYPRTVSFFSKILQKADVDLRVFLPPQLWRFQILLYSLFSFPYS